MAFLPNVAVLDALALIASALPRVSPPIPIYAVFGTDTLIPLTIPSSWVEFSPRYEAQVSDYPVEYGAFQQYNKIVRPITISVSLIKTGSDIERFAWLTAVLQQEAESPLQRYTLVSPQGVFIDYAVTGIAYETRPERGSNILYLSILFSQIQAIPSSLGIYDNTAQPKSGPVQQIGQLFTSAPSAAQNTLINAQKFITG